MELLENSHNSIEMPLVGYGNYQLSTSQAEICVAEALKAGFRHIDSAEGITMKRAPVKGLRRLVYRGERFL